MTDNKLEQAARQALGALVRAEAMYGQPNADIQTALRSALADSAAFSSEALAEQAEQSQLADASLEPVAWMDRDGNVCDNPDFGDRFPIPLYTHPVRTKDLTDDEIRAIWLKVIDPDGGDEVMALARAVIAADRSKNGIV